MYAKGEKMKRLDVLTMCGLYHDIGKALIPNKILTKPEKLNAGEYERIKEHPILGYEILKDEPIDKRIKFAALQHHERGDGSGYPYKTTRDYIAPFSRITAIADVYDAMTADRCYRAGICPFEVIAQFQREKPGRYDTAYLPVLLENIAHAYIGCDALLSDGSKGVISMINASDLSCPLIRLENDSFVNLEKRRDLYISACV